MFSHFNGSERLEHVPNRVREAHGVGRVLQRHHTGHRDRGIRDRHEAASAAKIKAWSRTTASPAVTIPRPRYSVGRNDGFRRALVACSNAYASLISVASLFLPAKNERPTGKPNAIPAGTVTCG